MVKYNKHSAWFLIIYGHLKCWYHELWRPKFSNTTNDITPKHFMNAISTWRSPIITRSLSSDFTHWISSAKANIGWSTVIISVRAIIKNNQLKASTCLIIHTYIYIYIYIYISSLNIISIMVSLSRHFTVGDFI